MTIAPFPPEGVTELWRWLNSPREPNFEDHGPQDFAGVEAALRAKERQGYTFALIEDGAPVGFIGFVPSTRIMGWFAGMVIAPEHRGRGCGFLFLSAVAQALREAGFLKLSALFYADNDAIARTFTRAGAVEEGFLIAAAQRQGDLVDMRLMSFTFGEIGN